MMISHVRGGFGPITQYKGVYQDESGGIRFGLLIILEQFACINVRVGIRRTDPYDFGRTLWSVRVGNPVIFASSHIAVQSRPTHWPRWSCDWGRFRSSDSIQQALLLCDTFGVDQQAFL
jgi:hypothetical protein